MKRIKWLDEGVRVRIQSEDDLWILSKICKSGSLVGMLSHRRDSTTGTKEEGRAKSAERKPMWILLEVIENYFQSFTDNLRVHGTIKDAKIDIGSHHTHVISLGDEVEITRQGGFKKSDLSLLKQSFYEQMRTKAGLLVIENDEVMIFQVASHGIRDISHFTLRGGGKRIADSSKIRMEFFEGVADEVIMVFQKEIPLILCGPGLTREQFEKDLLLKGIKNPITNVATSIGGRSAANEVLSEGLVDDFLGQHKLVEQIKLIERGLKEIAVDGNVAYGSFEISLAAKEGAIETLVIDANLLRTENKEEDERWEVIVDEINNSGGEIVQASVDHDSGKQLLGLGGAMALLRWKN